MIVHCKMIHSQRCSASTGPDTNHFLLVSHFATQPYYSPFSLPVVVITGSYLGLPIVYVPSLCNNTYTLPLGSAVRRWPLLFLTIVRLLSPRDSSASFSRLDNLYPLPSFGISLLLCARCGWQQLAVGLAFGTVFMMSNLISTTKTLAS